MQYCIRILFTKKRLYDFKSIIVLEEMVCIVNCFVKNHMNVNSVRVSTKRLSAVNFKEADNTSKYTITRVALLWILETLICVRGPNFAMNCNFF